MSVSSAGISRELSDRFGLPSGNDGMFADPFLMDSGMYMPRTMDTVWDYAMFLYYLNGEYRQAWKRIVSYFLTDIEFIGDDHGDEKEQKDLREILMDEVDIFGAFGLGGQECGCYGNSFFTHYRPFDRLLVDTREGGMKEYEVSLFEKFGPVKYDWRSMTYEVVDLRDVTKAVGKRRRIKLRFRDRPSRDITRFRVTRVDPRELTLIESPMHNKTRVVRRFSADFVQKIQSGDPFYCNEVPIELLESIAQSMDFAYHPSAIHHVKIPTILGLKNNGWGIPETIANYRGIHHLQVLRRIDEAVGQDYILPFRVFSPNMAQMGDNNIFDTLMSTWKGEISELIRRRRKDPYAIHAMPFPVMLQDAGGGANSKSLVQAEQIAYHTEALLDCTGVPLELYRGTMNVQNMPTSLRLFEGSWQFFYHTFNRLLRWTADAVQDIRRAARLDVRLQRSSMADDLEERGIYLQLAASGEISRERAYTALNITNAAEEKRKRMREDMDIQREQLRMEKEFQQEQMAGTLGEPQDPGASGGNGMGNPPAGVQTTPIDAQNDIDTEAQKLLAITDTGMRMKQLAQIRNTDRNKYALIKQRMEELRSEGASAGRRNVGQQLAQG